MRFIMAVPLPKSQRHRLKLTEAPRLGLQLRLGSSVTTHTRLHLIPVKRPKTTGATAVNNLEATEEIRASHECVPFFDYKTKTIFFTICSWNSLAYAITLWKSLTKFNGPVTVYLDNTLGTKL